MLIRTPGIPTLAVIATFVLCTFMLVVLNNSNNQRHSTRLTVHGGIPGQHHYAAALQSHSSSHKPQVEELSVFDPVDLKPLNISDL